MQERSHKRCEEWRWWKWRGSGRRNNSTGFHIWSGRFFCNTCIRFRRWTWYSRSLFIGFIFFLRGFSRLRMRRGITRCLIRCLIQHWRHYKLVHTKERIKSNESERERERKQNEMQQWNKTKVNTKGIHLLSVCASHNALVANNESNSSFTSKARVVLNCVCD